MVFFNCNACGESVKKAQVEKHYQFKCRSCNVLSCVDCGKEFWGDTYKEHTKCISEEEKYSGKDWKPKANANKGEQKQEAWLQQVRQAVSKAPPNPALRSLLQRLEDYPNIPRKQAKFVNFLGNSLRIRDTRLMAQAWDLLSAEMNKPKETPLQQNGDNKVAPTAPEIPSSQSEPLVENGTDDAPKLSKRERKEKRRRKQNKDEKKDKHGTDGQKEESEHSRKQKKKRGGSVDETQDTEPAAGQENRKKKKKRKHEEAEDEEEVPCAKRIRDCSEDSGLDTSLGAQEMTPPDPEVQMPHGRFKWEAVIVAALTKAPDRELSIKKLRKKVLAEFAAYGGSNSATCEKISSKLNKKIHKNPQLKVHKERVKLRN